MPAASFVGTAAKPLVREQSTEDRRHDLAVDWTELTNYEALIRIPEVRDRIARHANRSKKKLTGEEFLECCDKVLTPLTGGVPFTVIANIAQPLGEKLGLKTGKTRCERLAERPGTVLVAILCSLAETATSSAKCNNSPTAARYGPRSRLTCGRSKVIWWLPCEPRVARRPSKPGSRFLASSTIGARANGRSTSSLPTSSTSPKQRETRDQRCNEHVPPSSHAGPPLSR